MELLSQGFGGRSAMGSMSYFVTIAARSSLSWFAAKKRPGLANV